MWTEIAAVRVNIKIPPRKMTTASIKNRLMDIHKTLK
jgi:hypothetical protein